MANEKRHDLIDRKALGIGYCNPLVFDKIEYAHGWNCAIEILMKAPTVDAVEVVHGRWLPDMEEFDDDPAVGIRGGVFQTGWKCSICGRSEQVKEPYCNCGAKMDGDGNG